MSKVRLYGDTSGFVDLKAPDVANDVTITLPNTTGPFATETYVDSEIAAIPGIGSNVVQTVKTDTFTTSSTTYVPVTGLEATITPSSASSKVLVIVSLVASNSSVNDNALFRLLRGATSINEGDNGYIFYARTSATSEVNHGTIVYLDSPASSSAQTYAVNARANDGTMYLNRRGSSANGAGVSSVTLVEVAA